ncbi:response regulator [Marinobacter sp. HL-58]|uniref:response regulator n=1 Tax=Marinobacter sp. HL-58 TaxID=1479237 RepID=UPI0004822402|nr:response regulator [Marinobacter sp. HL-58]KPP97359.1 MAG: Response regulators consisting of a CheY-like receiver domain and a winged-helix DNA-binding domain [Marinobacter sp. HL-58]
MRSLILEDDVLLADLIETVVDGLYPGGTVFVTSSVETALEHWWKQGADLMIIDWNLPDGSGLDVVRTVRENDKQSPIVMVSGRSDRESVLKAAHYGISGYISKPFDVSFLHERLTVLVGPATGQCEMPPDLNDLLQSSMDSIIQLPAAFDAAKIIELFDRKEDLSVSQLAERWNGEVALTTRLLDVANSASLQKTGEPVRNLRDAIATLGVDRSLQHAMALSLDISGQLRDSRLAEIAAGFLETSKKVAGEAERIALRVGANHSEVHTAALLSRVGELAVLKVMQQCLDRNGLISDDRIEAELQTWAQRYGNRLKVQWHLPLQLRELIGAVHFLPRDATSKSKLIMRASALQINGEGSGEECLRLLRRLGLSDSNAESHNG